MNNIFLDKLTKQFVTITQTPPFLYQLPVTKAREKLEKIQSSPVFKYPAEIIKTSFKASQENIPIYIVSPPNTKTNKIIFYIHGAGWTYGSFHTHEKLVRELAIRSNALLIFPEYTKAPEAKYPTAIWECYHVLCKIPLLLKHIDKHICSKELIVAGDSVGGNMATVMTLLAKFYNGPKIAKQLLYYPVTNDDFNTESYNKYTNGWYLSKQAMEYFFNSYAPSDKMRKLITVTPLKASLNQLQNLPRTMIVNGEIDVLRSDGENYANKLMQAGVDVTQIVIKGTIHDFVMLNSLDKTSACRIAMDASIAWINRNY